MSRYILSLAFVLSSFSAIADDYDKILTRLQSYAKKPHVSLFTLGKNDQGKDIVGMIIGDVSSAQVKHLVVGTHHGNERAAADVPFTFADNVIAQYDSTVLFYVIPVLNISGYNVDRREETGSDKNTHDSNRDYEDACDTKHDFQLKSTTLIADFIDKENIVSAVSVHGYVGSFTYPWGTYLSDYATLDDNMLATWAAKAAKLNGYQTGTHGAVVYPAAGAFEDWAYLKHGVWSFLMEIRSPSSDLKKDGASLYEFFKNSPKERSAHVGQKVNCVKHILEDSNRSRP